MTNTSELARLLEVSPRTVLRDVEALSTAGVPVYTQPGRGGGIGLLPGYRTDVSALSEQEGAALFAAIAAPGADALGLGDALASALRKIMAALPDARRPSAARLAERVVIDTGGWLPRSEEPLLALAKEAVLGDWRVELDYQGRADAASSLRIVDPYGLLHTGGVWYLAAGHLGQPRFYRLARVSHLRILDQVAVRPDGLDLRRLWAEHRAEFRSALTPLDVDLWVQHGRLGDLAERSGEVTQLGATGWPAPGTDGDWVGARVMFGDISHAWSVIGGLADDVVVVTPAGLRERVVTQARAVLAKYGEAD